MTTKDTIAATVLSIGLSVSPALAQEAGSDKFLKNPRAPVTEEDMRYTDKPGNEFTMIFRSHAFPEGKSVVIDPDDMIPVNDPRKSGRVVLAPRQRFFYEINSQLPGIPGREMPRMKDNEGLSPGGAVVIFKHLTDPPIVNNKGEIVGGGHGIPKEQILEAMRLCHKGRNIPEPSGP